MINQSTIHALLLCALALPSVGMAAQEGVSNFFCKHGPFISATVAGPVMLCFTKQMVSFQDMNNSMKAVASLGTFTLPIFYSMDVLKNNNLSLGSAASAAIPVAASAMTLYWFDSSDFTKKAITCGSVLSALILTAIAYNK